MLNVVDSRNIHRKCSKREGYAGNNNSSEMGKNQSCDEVSETFLVEVKWAVKMAAKEHNTQDLFNVSRHKISVTKVCGDECVDKITKKNTKCMYWKILRSKDERKCFEIGERI